MVGEANSSTYGNQPDSSPDGNQSDNEEDELVWYFSYGSNMNPKVFEERRKVKPRDFCLCRVPGYVLTFAEAMFPYAEPAFCTCVKREEMPYQDDGRPDIHGVAFLITKREYEVNVLATEGGWGWQEYRNHPLWSVGSYGLAEVDCVEVHPSKESSSSSDQKQQQGEELATVAAGCIPRKFKALTLVGLFGPRQRFDCNASQRYYDIVIDGARTSGLPQSYQEYLRTKHPPFVMPNTWGAAICRQLYFWACFFPCGILIITNFLVCAKLNSRYGLSLRMPWMICKFSYLYQRYVIKTFLATITEDFLRIPNGHKNADSLDGNAAAPPAAIIGNNGIDDDYVIVSEAPINDAATTTVTTDTKKVL